MNLGTLIRRRRKEKKLTLRQVAEAAGVSEGFISQVENNVKAPSLDTLNKICQAVGAEAGAILQELSETQRLYLIRAGEWGDIDIPHTGFATRRFCPPEERSVMDSAIILLEPGRSIPVRKNLKNGQEVLCVLRGQLELVHGDTVERLGPGDSAHYFADPQNQSITNPGDEEAVLLWVGTI